MNEPAIKYCRTETDEKQPNTTMTVTDFPTLTAIDAYAMPCPQLLPDAEQREKRLDFILELDELQERYSHNAYATARDNEKWDEYTSALKKLVEDL